MLDQDEVETLLREALFARGVTVPGDYVFRLRRNNKKTTIRVAFVAPMPQSAGDANLVDDR
ncbi:hypothetical protein N9917_01445 [Deltaproteobacteria bacterium]|nr:hypothetical protein [Deltaproteobacteria bacterium]